MKYFEKLCSIGSAPIVRSEPNVTELTRAFGQDLGSSIASLYGTKNGFYAFEGALHVLPAVEAPHEGGIVRWNERPLWRAEFAGMADVGVFFAEDVFGNQFCLRTDGVFTFDPETGAYERMASDIDDWAQRILADYNLFSGWSLAHEWQEKNGPLLEGYRLLPKRPFVVGGEYAISNLHPVEAVKGMRFRGSIAVQIRDLPDGAQIKFNVL